jgi:hypothetical protein
MFRYSTRGCGGGGQTVSLYSIRVCAGGQGTLIYSTRGADWGHGGHVTCGHGALIYLTSAGGQLTGGHTGAA